MKGISPLLASVLLIAFTVTIAALVFSFMTTTVRSTTVTISNRTGEGIDCSTASISIEDVYVIGTSNATVNVVVKNSGITDNLRIQDAQLINSSGGNFSSASTPLEDFDKGELATLTFNRVVVSVCPSSFSKVIVATSCAGVSDTFDGSPKCL